ncbi:hypothetical protein HY484_00840, partial [Candidatus Woesearchaeota archaeon]|nr:hypothetical protein [Candidatus Woesearchaeota archaeon]
MIQTPHLPDRETLINELIQNHLKTKYDLTNEEIKKYIYKQPTKTETHEITIPATIFNDVLSPFETIVKYLKEVKGL